MTINIRADGSLDGFYTLEGKSSPPGKPCWVKGRFHYFGHLTGTLRPAAVGTLEAARVWCPGSPQGSGMNVPAERFRMWYEQEKGVVLDIGDRHYRVIYPDPSVDPFFGGNSVASTGSTTFPAGKWQTTFGTMVLQVQNGHIRGVYTHDNGRITGTLNGRRLVCRWFEAPSYRPTHDAGECYFDFSKNGKTFTGKWRYSFGTGKWDGEWSGYRIDGRNGGR